MNNKVESNAVWSNINGDAELNMSSNSNFTTNSSNKACYKCGGIIPAESEFCGYCGIKLSQDCPKCNNRYSSQLKFCPKCGTNRDEYLLHQIRLEEQRDEVRIMQESKQKYKERIEYIIGRMKIQFAPMRYVYKVYYQDECGSEIEMANGKYLGQWYEDAHGTRISNMFNKIFDNHRFSCGCVEKNNKWAAVRFTSDNSTSKGAISVTRITSFDFDTPFVFEQMVIDGKSLIAANVKLNNKSYVLTQEGALLEREDIFRREQTGEKIIKNKERVKTLIYTLIMLVLLWIVAIVLENLTPDDLGMIWVGLILTAIFIIVMIGNWIMIPSSFVEPIYVNKHFVTYKLMKQYIVESLK